jgi:hypothetical protein
MVSVKPGFDTTLDDVRTALSLVEARTRDEAILIVDITEPREQPCVTLFAIGTASDIA